MKGRDALIAILLWPLAAAAEEAPAPADRAAALIAKAEVRLREAETPEGRLAALGAAVSAYESGLAAIRGGLRDLAAREARLTEEIARDERAHRDLLGLLLVMERTPAPAMLAHPLGPVGHARAARTMAEIAPRLEGRTAALRTRLFELRDLRARQDAAQEEITAALAALQDARAALAAALRARGPAPEAAPAAELAAAGARSFAEFAAALPAGGAAAEGFDAAKGRLPPPVEGEVALRFGETDETGAPIAGVRVAAPAHAAVSAPWTATIRYAGPLAGHGNVVILEPGARRLIVLAGLARIDRRAGETVLAGESLGQLGVIEQDSEEFLIEATSNVATIADETLYIEVRVDGAPVDPAGWFAFAE